MDWKNQQQMACNYNRRHKEKTWLENIAHTHNALEDAKEQSKIFGKTMTLYLYNI